MVGGKADGPFEPRLSFVTLGVSDMSRARAFYEALGFKASSASRPSVTFFALAGCVLSLFGREALAEDAETSDGPAGFAGVALAYNARSEAEVDALVAHAVASGARLAKSPRKVIWGGYAGYFADPDGHLWEVAFNPFMPLDEKGRPTLPPP